jgi:hypothetical protein
MVRQLEVIGGLDTGNGTQPMARGIKVSTFAFCLVVEKESR